MSDKESIKESDLFLPVASFLENLGYAVKGEVGNCDVVGKKGEELLVVELKKGMTIQFLTQAVDRQRIGDLVYMAVPKPKKLKMDAEFKRLIHLVRRLELGLLFVSFSGKEPRVEVVVEAEAFDRARSMAGAKKKKGKLKVEHDSRKNTLNIGGVNKKKILTAYRERALEIAEFLSVNGVTKISDIRDATGIEKAGSFLSANFYGWFQRIEKGHYDITEAGKNGLMEYADYIQNKQS